jgi:uncharacterized glyoxalase superfamily protein PhnB
MSIATKPPPKGWPRLSAAVYYNEAATAIDWLCKAFGFDIQLKIEGEGGRIEHSELVLGGGLVSVGDTKLEKDRPWRKSPAAVGGVNTQSLCIYIDDVDAHCVRAKAAGATIVADPKTTDYGDDYWSDRSYEAIDLEGHHWWFMQRMREKS